MMYFLDMRVNTRRKKQSEKRKHIFSFGYVQRMEVSEFTGRAEEMRKSANLSQKIAQRAWRHGGIRMRREQEDALPLA